MTSAPSRFHTLPSSSPITPAPITPRRLGTSAKSSAPALSTISWPSNFANGSSIGLRAGGEDHVGGGDRRLAAVVGGDLDLAARQQAAEAGERA